MPKHRDETIIDPAVDEDARYNLPKQVTADGKLLTMSELLDMGEGVDLDGKPVMIIQQIINVNQGLFSPLTVSAAKSVIIALQNFVDDHTPKETIN